MTTDSEQPRQHDNCQKITKLEDDDNEGGIGAATCGVGGDQFKDLGGEKDSGRGNYGNDRHDENHDEKKEDPVITYRSPAEDIYSLLMVADGEASRRDVFACL